MDEDILQGLNLDDDDELPDVHLTPKKVTWWSGVFFCSGLVILEVQGSKDGEKHVIHMGPFKLYVSSKLYVLFADY